MNFFFWLSHSCACCIRSENEFNSAYGIYWRNHSMVMISCAHILPHSCVANRTLSTFLISSKQRLIQFFKREKVTRLCASQISSFHQFLLQPENSNYSLEHYICVTCIRKVLRYKNESSIDGYHKTLAVAINRHRRTLSSSVDFHMHLSHNAPESSRPWSLTSSSLFLLRVGMRPTASSISWWPNYFLSWSKFSRISRQPTTKRSGAP
jgi:hypothetical protein